MTGIDLKITHIGTATAILNINGINLLTDPVFPDAGFSVTGKSGNTIKTPELPALGLADLPHIDGILLSHEDHPDNLDEKGRTLITGRRVLTTMDGKANLGNQPDVYGMKPWETRSINFGGKELSVTATPCRHLPGGECIGFLVHADDFGTSAEGLPNAIYFSGDTVYIEELQEITKRVHVSTAIFNLGSAHVNLPDGRLQITMDAEQAIRLFRDIKADYLVPMHFVSWSHFTEGKEEIAKAFDEAGLGDKVYWLTPGQQQKIL